MAKPNARKLILEKGLIAAAAVSALVKVGHALNFGADPSYQDSEQAGWSALHFCCYFSKIDKPAGRICKMLLDRGANPDAQAHDGLTPLLAARAVGSVDVVRLLLGASADVNLSDNAGRTPLMAAAERGCCPIVELLIAAGARVNLLDREGRDAIAIARDAAFSSSRGDESRAAAALLEAALLQAEIGLSPKRFKA